MATFLDGLCRSAAKRSIINLDPLRRQTEAAMPTAGDISILNPHHLNRLTFLTVLREFEPKKATILLFTGKILLWSRRSCRDSRRGMLLLSCLA